MENKGNAQKEKDKGNASFKSGDYPTAIGFYTQAMILDPTDPTYATNRAMAYLKLNKFEDAQRDSTTALQISGPSKPNPKALYRRGLARKGLEKYEEALKDLDQALSQEPSNQSIKTEISQVRQLLSESKKSQEEKNKRKGKRPISPPNLNRREESETKATTDDVTSTSAPKTASTSKPRSTATLQKASDGTNQDDTEDDTLARRTARLKAAVGPSSSDDLISSSNPDRDFKEIGLKQVSTRKISPQMSGKEQNRNRHGEKEKAKEEDQNQEATATISSSGENTKGGGFLAAKAAREKREREKSSLSKKDSPATKMDDVNPTGPATPKKAGALTNVIKKGNGDTLPPPKTAFEFEQRWNEFRGSLEEKKLLEKRWEVISSIEPGKIPAIFGNSLEPDLIGTLLAVLSYGQSNDNSPEVLDFVKAVLTFIPKTNRFDFIGMLLGSEELRVAGDLIQKTGAGEDVSRDWGLS